MLFGEDFMEHGFLRMHTDYEFKSMFIRVDSCPILVAPAG